MRVPDGLDSLVSEGIITQVIRPLMSGKEAQIYLVESGGELRVAKLYKDAAHRSFKHRAEYTEGRGVRSSRDARAMQKRSKYGRAMDEEAWRSAEVDVIHRLRSAGVRVPEPFQFTDGVLIMELVTDAEGHPAPRLGDLQLSATEARAVFEQLLREVVRMLCAGVVHGDLSDFNVLIGPAGPVIIDFPQAVDPARNQNARDLLIRDVDNLTTFLAPHDPAVKKRPYGQEMWAAYESGELTPDTVLTGNWRPSPKDIDLQAILAELASAELDESRRRVARGLPPLDGAQAQPRPQQPRAHSPQPHGRRQPQAQPQRGQPQAQHQRGQQQAQPRRDHQQAQPRRDHQQAQPRRDHQQAQPRRDHQQAQPRRDHQQGQQPRRGQQAQPQRGQQRAQAEVQPQAKHARGEQAPAQQRRDQQTHPRRGHRGPVPG